MWYIEYLLMNRTIIKLSCDIESDEYNDLVIVEKEIGYFTKNNLFSTVELNVLKAIMEGNFYYEKDSENTVAFLNICDRLSASLGGIFTDEGYIDYLREKYKLSPEQVIKVEKFIKSKFRHKILRKPFEEN